MSDQEGPVRINRVVTRGGDAGMTALADGSRVAKHNVRIEAVGAVDEANASLGVLRALVGAAPIASFIEQIQNDLFDLGAGICRPGAASHLASDALARLEAGTEALNEKLAPLTSFVLPGGTLAAAEAHRARTIARRAERCLWTLHAGDSVDPLACRYVNRLSDFLFVAARHLNDDGRTDVTWSRHRAVEGRGLIFLVRHGPPRDVAGRCYGRLDIAADLPRPLPRLPRATIWSSPAARCRLLAVELGRRHGRRPRLDRRLQELDFGAWEGQAWDTLDRDRIAAWARAPLGRSGPGSESAAALIARCCLFARALSRRPGHHVVVSHGGPLVVLQALLERRPVRLLARRQSYGEVRRLRTGPPLR